MIIIVSGLPRSGTSLMMKMLEAGGIEPLTDEIREADVDNPKGYYEFERVKGLPEDTSWLADAEGKAVKVLAELIKHLPEGYHYRVIFMLRDLDEIVSSQKKMMVRRGEDPGVPDGEMRDLLRRYLVSLKRYINRRQDMDVLYVSYNEVLDEPEEPLGELLDFLGSGIDPAGMRGCVDPKLYRNRG